MSSSKNDAAATSADDQFFCWCLAGFSIVFVFALLLTPIAHSAHYDHPTHSHVVAAGADDDDDGHVHVITTGNASAGTGVTTIIVHAAKEGPAFLQDQLSKHAAVEHTASAYVRRGASPPLVSPDAPARATATARAGLNVDYAACESQEARDALQRAAQWDERTLRDVRVRAYVTSDAALVLDVDAPYVANDGAYVLTLGAPLETTAQLFATRNTLLHTPGTCDFVPGTPGNASSWLLHEPNAHFAMPPIASDHAGGWVVQPSSCARVRFVRVFTELADAASCALAHGERNAALAVRRYTPADSEPLVEVRGTLYVSLVRDASHTTTESKTREGTFERVPVVVHAQRAVNVSAVFDAHESSVALAGPLALHGVTWQDADGSAHVTLRAPAPARHALAAIVERHESGSGMLQATVLNANDNDEEERTAFTLALRSHDNAGVHVDGAVYDGLLRVTTLNSADGDDESTTYVDVSLSNPAAMTADVENVAQKMRTLSLEITQHLAHSPTATIHNDVVMHGADRVCMQVFAVGESLELMRALDVHVRRVWLCTRDTDAGAADAPLPAEGNVSGVSGCTSLPHYVVLFDADADEERESRGQRAVLERQRAVYAPAVHEPGSYGSWSASVCFNASAIFIDAHGTRVIRAHQYAQIEAQVTPTQQNAHLRHGRHYDAAVKAGGLVDAKDTARRLELTEPSTQRALQAVQTTRFATKHFTVHADAEQYPMLATRTKSA